MHDWNMWSGGGIPLPTNWPGERVEHCYPT